jgi:hypothetical protein
MREVLGTLGEKYEYYATRLNEHIGDEFYRNLEALEVFFNTVNCMREEELLSQQDNPHSEIDPDMYEHANRRLPELQGLIKSFLNDSEVDLEIR